MTTNLGHGGDIYSVKEEYQGEILDFSANINPLGMPQAVHLAAQAAVSQAVHYPDPLSRALRQGIAIKNGLTMDQVICGNGAADLIFRLAEALAPRKAIVLAPTFSEYEQALDRVNCQVQHHMLYQETNFDLTDSIFRCLTEDVDLLWLCNPNNPTGRLIKKDLLLEILRICQKKNIWLVVDECFLELCDEKVCNANNLSNQLGDYSQLFLLRAFTKSYAMPGLRLGYGLSNNLDLLNKMNNCGQPWPISVIAQRAGLQALAEKDFLQRSQNYITQERYWLRQELIKLGLWVGKGAANYLLFKYEGNLNIRQAMLRKGILIRSCNNYNGLNQHYYRIAIRQREDNQRLILALTQCLEE